MVITLIEMLTSKKFIMSIAATIVALLAKVGLNLDTEAIATIIAPIVAYILAQGWSDSGKSAAKVTALAETVNESQREAIKAS